MKQALKIVFPTHVSMEHVLIWLMATAVPAKQALLEQIVILTLMIVLPTHVSMEHVPIKSMDTDVPVNQDTLEQTVTCWCLLVCISEDSFNV